MCNIGLMGLHPQSRAQGIEFGVSGEALDLIEFWGKSCPENINQQERKGRDMRFGKISQQQRVAKEVLSKLSIIDPYAILAGGAPRDWYLGKPCKDLDFYFYSCGNTIASVEGQLRKALGDSVTYMDRNELNDKFPQYRKMEMVERVFTTEVDGISVQFIKLRSPDDQFKVVDTMSVSICKIWCNLDSTGKLRFNLTEDFKITMASRIMFLSSGYSWADPHPKKMIDRFFHQAPNSNERFYSGTKSQAIHEIVAESLKKYINY